MAVVGFQNVSLLKGQGRLEVWSSGRRAIRALPGQQFVSREATGMSDAELDAIFTRLAAECNAGANNLTGNVQESVRAGASVIEMVGLRRAIYKVNYIEQVLVNLPKYTPQMRQFLQLQVQQLLQRFVEEVVRPKAMSIIDELVYQPSLAHTAARMSFQRSGIDIASKRGNYQRHLWLSQTWRRVERRAELIQAQTGRPQSGKLPYRGGKDTGFGIGEESRISHGQTLESLGSGISPVSGDFGFRSLFRNQKMQRLALQGMARDTQAAAGFMMAQYGNRLNFPRYAGATGVLRQALNTGIIAAPNSFVIGINEAMFPPRRGGANPVYWGYVEYGHVYRWKNPRTGKIIDTGMREPEKPFMRTLQAWMNNEGRQLLEQRIRDLFNSFKSKVGALFAKTFAGKGLTLGMVTGTDVESFFQDPMRSQFASRGIGGGSDPYAEAIANDMGSGGGRMIGKTTGEGY